MRLLVQQRVHRAVSLPRGRHRIRVLRQQLFCGGEPLLKGRVRGRQVTNHEGLVLLRATRQHGGDKSNADVMIAYIETHNLNPDEEKSYETAYKDLKKEHQLHLYAN